MRFKYLVHPGHITRCDGNRHYVGASELMALYGVPPSECAVMSDRLFLATSAYWRDSLIQLDVRPEGDYREHLAQVAAERHDALVAAGAQCGLRGAAALLLAQIAGA